jgi:hypothetical protein
VYYNKLVAASVFLSFKNPLCFIQKLINNKIMKTKNRTGLFFCLLPVIFLSCKKENKDDLEILTSKTWKYGLTDHNMATNPPGVILYHAVQTCEQDDRLVFKPDGRLIINRGYVQCNSSEKAIDTVSYSYDKFNKKLTVDGVVYIIAGESTSQIKYYIATPSASGYNWIVFLLE